MSGLDAAEGLVAIARERVPEGDFRVGDLEMAWRPIAAAYAPLRQPDGRYRLENAFRYVVARA